MSLCVCYSLCVCVLLFTRKKLCAGYGESTGKELFKMCVCLLLCVCFTIYKKEKYVQADGSLQVKRCSSYKIDMAWSSALVQWVFHGSTFFNYYLCLIFKWTFKWTSEMCTYKNEVVCVSVRDWAIFVRMKMRVGWVCVRDMYMAGQLFS